MGLEPHRFEALGLPAPRSLTRARVELHWAAQLPAAAGRSLITPAPDDSHTSLEWLAGPRMLASGRLPGGLRAALRPADLMLVALDPTGTTADELALEGRTFDEALGWLAGRLGAGAMLARPPYELPEHPVSGRGSFQGGDEPARVELGRWYATGDAILRGTLGAPGAAPVRCWPHHFDIATLLPGPGQGHTIGAGLSPGDESYAQPYWYVSPQPNPEPGALPALAAGGHWHSAGWVGAVLTAEESLRPATPDARAAQVADFLKGAVSACAAVLARA